MTLSNNLLKILFRNLKNDDLSRFIFIINFDENTLRIYKFNQEFKARANV